MWRSGIALGSGPRDRRFDPCHPDSRTSSSAEERLLYTQRVGGSTPSSCIPDGVVPEVRTSAAASIVDNLSVRFGAVAELVYALA